ncbi:transcriptional regulator [Megasphaera elsdenii]|uniref:phage late control D family protein n=1 Tax=Megasphaera elsdenii TaxID=907 RepID=UPI002E75AD0B|nr:transcriptional regulator [Megasphaera elsdenii]MEE0404152.1 transcriptional regulator [Megasphaera elsdenii]
MAVLQSLQKKITKLKEQATAGLLAQEHIGRRAWLIVTYNGKDISESLAQYVLSFSYTDNLTGQVDDISITLEDRAELWEADWMPERGATLDITICTYNWSDLYSEEQDLQLGKFEIDELEVSSAPNVVTIKAVAISISDDSTLRSTLRSHTWENISVQKAANDIAWQNGMKLQWYCDDNPNIDKLEQNDESDLDVLQKICDDAGFALKVTTDTIIIFDVEKFEKEDVYAEYYHPGTTILNIVENQPKPVQTDALLNYSFKAKIRDVYKKCHVKYAKDKDKSVIESTFIAPDKKEKEGATLEVHQQVSSQAEADRLAKKKLREKNCEEFTGSFASDGNMGLCAGETIEMIGFGNFSGKYIITQAKHDINSSGFTSSVEIRKCLDGY